MKNFQKASETLDSFIKQIFEYSIMVVSDDEDHISIGMKGKASDMLRLTNELVKSLRSEMEKKFGKRLTEVLLETALFDDERISDEVEQLQKGEIPAWLKKHMFEEEEDDEDEDSVSDSDTDDEDSAEERLNRLADALRDVCCTRGDCPVCGDDLRDEDRG